jgi:hypothetical protein
MIINDFLGKKHPLAILASGSACGSMEWQGPNMLLDFPFKNQALLL